MLNSDRLHLMKHLQLLAVILTLGLSAHAEVTRPECAAFASDLVVMVAADQALMRRYDPAAGPAAPENLRARHQIELIGRQNTEHLKRLVKACGWPKRSVYGPQAVDDAFLVAQHSDHDRKFQRTVITLLQSAVPAGEAHGTHLAYLSDRIAVADGKPQLFGTQLDDKGPCQLEFFPLDDRAKVEERRKAIGLPPLEEYKKDVEASALPPSCGGK
jgi:hypothetical protein